MEISCATFANITAFKSSSNAVTKAEAGGYLWRKLGMLGLVTGAHTFVPKQFMHMVSKSSVIDPKSVSK